MPEKRHDSPLHLPPEVMRALGYQAVDALVERWAGRAEGAAWVGADREHTDRAFTKGPPAVGRSPEQVLREALEVILPMAGRVDHPRFMAFIPSEPTWPGVLGDFLAAGHNTFQGTWLESAGPSQIELIVLDWFRSWIGYPVGASGLLTTGASAASLTALAAARFAVDEAAPAAERVLYVSDQTHYSIARAARVVGLGSEQIRTMPTVDFRMDVGALEQALRLDRRAGRSPVAVVATAGTTNTGAVDPLEDIADVCDDASVWMHVDAAYGGFAVLSKRCAGMFDGLTRADSIALDPHKWLYQPYEVGCLMVREPSRLLHAFRVMPEYLQDAELGADQVNFADRGIQLTRSFRALKIWMSVQTFGVNAFRTAVDAAVRHTERAEAWIKSQADMEVLSPASLGVVCYRLNPADRLLSEQQLEDLNRAAQDAVVQAGVAMLSSTRIRGTYSLRLCILNHSTTWDDVRTTLRAILSQGQAHMRSHG